MGILRRGWWWRLPLWLLLALMLLVGSGWLLADHLTPRAVGAPSQALPVRDADTALDREVGPILSRHPGESGVLVVPDGVDAFAARVTAAREAGRSLDLQYFIWHDDMVGRLLAREVWNAAQRGVRVRMLLDDINLNGNDNALMTLDSNPNIEIRLYNPFRNRAGPLRMLEMAQRFTSIDHRMHNKAWIADARVAIVGGRNISEQYFDADRSQNFRDLDAVVIGPAVAQAERVFDSFWNSAAAVPVSAFHTPDAAQADALRAKVRADLQDPRALAYLARAASAPRLQDYLTQTLRPHWTAQAQIVSDPPLKWKHAGRDGWMVERIAKRMQEVRRQALIISPYFVPGDYMTQHMVAAAKHDVYIGVVTNSLATNDVAAVYSGYSVYRPALLRAGVKLYELKLKAHRRSLDFGDSMASLHTKAFEIDGEQGFIGSFNLDPRSAHLNTEMGLFFRDPGIAADVRREYLRLTGPQLSDWVYLDPAGHVRWLDRAVQPPVVRTVEPDTTWWQRLKAKVVRWLPVESQV